MYILKYWFYRWTEKKSRRFPCSSESPLVTFRNNLCRNNVLKIKPIPSSQNSHQAKCKTSDENVFYLHDFI